MSHYLIYALIDPRDRSRFFVGKSTSGTTRPRAHGSPSVLRDSDRSNPAKARLIRELQSSGLRYEIEVLEYLPAPDKTSTPVQRLPFGVALGLAERRWIANGRAARWPLLNRTDGGENVVGPTAGVSPSLETRAKLSKALKGRVLSEAHKNAIALGRTGCKVSAAGSAKLSMARAGKPKGKQRPEVVAARAARQTGRPGKIPSDESRARMSEAAKRAWASGRRRAVQ